MQKIADLVQGKNLNNAGRLAAKMLAVLAEENPSVEDAKEAAYLVHTACKCARNETAFKEAVLSQSDAEYFTDSATTRGAV